MSLTKYEDFTDLKIDRPAPGVLRVTLNRPDKRNALTPAMHLQIEKIWSVIDEDPSVRCAIVTGAGNAFCAGADVGDLSEAEAPDPARQFFKDFRGGAGLVKALIDCKKPIVSAINGSAVGAGLALALLCDVPIAAKQAKLFDGHVRIGVTAGDHAAMIWPLLCGMAKSKYFLLTNEPMTGEQAERNNLVALAVDLEELEQKSIDVAAKIAGSAPTAVRATKHVLNHWLRQAQPIFELSLAMELVNFQGAEAAEAITAQLEKRVAQFDKDSTF
jgi:enoyl-CoA hydratase